MFSPLTPLAPSSHPSSQSALLRDLRDRIARIERGGAAGGQGGAVPLGIPAIDQVLPARGLALGGLHEAFSAGPDSEPGAVATLFVAGVLARMDGPVLWVVGQNDLFPPGLAGAGLHPDRVIFAAAGRHVLPAMEEGLRHAGLASVVGEISGRLTLIASRRLQLAAEQFGVLAVALRRSPRFDDPAWREPTAAVTRWRIAALPSPPALPHSPGTQGLGRARWRLSLTRCRGGETGSWIVEACDATGHLALVAELADGSDQEAWRLRG